MEQNSFKDLPEGYRLQRSLNLKENKRTYFTLVLTAVFAACAMVVAMSFFVPVSSYFEANSRSMAYGAFLTGAVAYILLHELTHCLILKRYRAENVKTSFLSLASYPKSSSYISKNAYVKTALAPLILFGAVLLILNFLVPSRFFWLVYMLQTLNVMGSIPDIFVVFLISRRPPETLVLCVDSDICIFTKQSQTLSQDFC